MSIMGPGPSSAGASLGMPSGQQPGAQQPGAAKFGGKNAPPPDQQPDSFQKGP